MSRVPLTSSNPRRCISALYIVVCVLFLSFLLASAVEARFDPALPAGEALVAAVPDGEGYAAISRLGDPAGKGKAFVYIGGERRGPYEDAAFPELMQGGVAYFALEGGKMYAYTKQGRSPELEPYDKDRFAAGCTLASKAGKLLAIAWASSPDSLYLWEPGARPVSYQEILRLARVPSSSFCIVWGARNGARGLYSGGTLTDPEGRLVDVLLDDDGIAIALARSWPVRPGESRTTTKVAAKGLKLEAYDALHSRLERGKDGLLRFLARRGPGVYFVKDGKEVPLPASVATGACMAPDGSALCYRSEGDGSSALAYYRDEERFDFPSVLETGKDGRPVRYVARRGTSDWVVGFGKELGPFQEAFLLGQSGPSQPLVAYREGKAWFVALGPATYGPFVRVWKVPGAAGVAKDGVPIFVASKGGSDAIWRGATSVRELRGDSSHVSVAPDGSRWVALEEDGGRIRTSESGGRTVAEPGFGLGISIAGSPLFVFGRDRSYATFLLRDGALVRTFVAMDWRSCAYIDGGRIGTLPE